MLSPATDWRVVCRKFSLFTVISHICWAVFAPSRGVRFSQTILSLGFLMMTHAVPPGLTSVLFHMISIFIVGITSWPLIKTFGKIFIDAPQCIWNYAGFLLMNIFARISLGQSEMSSIVHTFSHTLLMNLTSLSVSLWSAIWLIFLFFCSILHGDFFHNFGISVPRMDIFLSTLNVSHRKIYI